MKVTDQAIKNREAIEKIKSLYNRGLISRKAAQELAEPVIKRINKRGAEIAKEHGKKSYTGVDFINLMR
ncbi:hypothetical protein [Polynucleobacter sp.]|uniref:hypothetical protein n=1 Tax=Polynucleobacter sp. TaxID=2029855 RepID=UPI003F6A2C49